MRNLINIRIPGPLNTSLNEELWGVQVDENDQICSLKPMLSGAELSLKGEDWHGDLLSPRGVDLQINGGLGLSFTDFNVQQLPQLNELLDLLWSDGVEAIAPTLVSCSVPSLRNSLMAFRQARKQSSNRRCKLLGAHIEGPFLAPTFQGAHDPNQICLPSLHALNERIRGFEKEIALVTLAPELQGSIEVIRKLNELGILVSLGHSAANTEQCKAAFDLGVSMITHCFNAMPEINHREPGPVVVALLQDEIAMGLIADGVHVHPNVALILHKLAANRLFLVSDALAPYGLQEKCFKWDQRFLYIEEGSCRLGDGTLAGTTCPLLNGCKKLAKWTGEPSSAIWAATVSPRLLFQKGKKIQEFFIGRSLKELLRWQFHLESNLLNWKPAE